MPTYSNCIIVHGCCAYEEKDFSPESRTYDKHWMPWLKRKLIESRLDAVTPMMPEPWQPDYEKFKTEFEKYPLNENTILIGHSCGSAFLVRWLGETKKKIAKLILVAPWKMPDQNDEFREKFYNYEIDQSIKSRVGKIVMFTADNEENDGKQSLKIFQQALGGDIIDLNGHGHYTFEDMGTEEFPELLQVVLEH